LVTRDLPRVQKIVIPVLRSELTGVKVGSWIEDIDYREFPLVNVRRLGGPGLKGPRANLDLAVIELTAYTGEGLIQTEDLLLDARQVIYDMVSHQKVTPDGYIHSYFETMAPTQFDSPFEDTWRIQCLIQLGVRPPRT
jgi:hypothetical protein